MEDDRRRTDDLDSFRRRVGVAITMAQAARLLSGSFIQNQNHDSPVGVVYHIVIIVDLNVAVIFTR